MSRAVVIVRKILALLPTIAEVVARIEEARDPSSPGGARITPAELAKLIAEGVKDIGLKLADIFEKG